jgi:hypothetical protein
MVYRRRSSANTRLTATAAPGRAPRVPLHRRQLRDHPPLLRRPLTVPARAFILSRRHRHERLLLRRALSRALRRRAHRSERPAKVARLEAVGVYTSDAARSFGYPAFSYAKYLKVIEYSPPPTTRRADLPSSVPLAQSASFPADIRARAQMRPRPTRATRCRILLRA